MEDPAQCRAMAGLTGTSLISTILGASADKGTLDTGSLAFVLAGHATGTGLEQPGPPDDMAALEAAVNRARRRYQACRYTELINQLPQLLVRLHAASQSLEVTANAGRARFPPTPTTSRPGCC